MSYAIRNRRTKKWVYGTDKRYYPPHQRTSFDECIVYYSYESAADDFCHRRCGKEYEIVPVRIVEESEAENED